MTKEEPVKQ